MARKKKQIHKYFPLDTKTETTILIFHYVLFNVTTHIYACQNIYKPQFIIPGLEHNRSSLNRIYKIPWAENHHA